MRPLSHKTTVASTIIGGLFLVAEITTVVRVQVLLHEKVSKEHEQPLTDPQVSVMAILLRELNDRDIRINFQIHRVTVAILLATVQDGQDGSHITGIELIKTVEHSFQRFELIPVGEVSLRLEACLFREKETRQQTHELHLSRFQVD